MGLELLLQGAAAAASVGMGCGTCCGSGISVFLSGYLMTHARNFRQSVWGFLSFYLGKLMAVMGICGAAALIGSQVLDENGCIAGVPVKAVVDAAMIGMGLWLLVRWMLEQKGIRHCHGGCGTGRNEPKYDGKVSMPALWGMGVGYGISPCAPLLVMAGYASTLPFGYALAVGGLFALASAVSPMLLMLLLSGVLAGKIYQEIPQQLKWFRLGCYVLVIGFFTWELIGLLAG